MGPVITFFSKVDAAVQRRFDSVCFFLMRRFGVRKSSIRYALNALLITAFGGGLMMEMRYGIASPFGIFIGSLFILLLLIAQHFGVRDDREAEAKPGTASVADRNARGGLWKAIAFLFLLMTLPEFRYPPAAYQKAGLTGNEHVFPTLCDTIFWLAYLAWMYLQKTPMNPPPEKVVESVGAPQTAPAKS